MINVSPENIERLETVVKGRRVRYIKAGSGRPVLLIHGGASSSKEWRPIMSRYAGLYSFYAPDLPGFGESDRDPKGYYLADFSEFLLGFIELLKIKKPALVGHSFGARVCLDAALASGDTIGKLILIDASGLGKMSIFGLQLFNFFTMLRNLTGQRQPFPIFLSKEGVDWNDIGDEALKNIKTPTLLIWKSFDPYLSVKQGRRAVRIMPNAEMAVIPGYGHAPHQQKDNSLFCKLMLDFLSRQA
ncbi:MAG TPA: alpha/beta hydrolase [Dehalococcoidales bacterium]|nr:alpha/beta hydrolase [Dehalococcoidales bacterium]